MAADSEIESLQAKVRRLEERLHILEAQCTCRLTPVEKTDAESSTAGKCSEARMPWNITNRAKPVSQGLAQKRLASHLVGSRKQRS